MKFPEKRRKSQEDAHSVDFGASLPSGIHDTTAQDMARSINRLSALWSEEKRVFHTFSDDERMIDSLVQDFQTILDAAFQNGHVVCRCCGRRNLLGDHDDPELESSVHRIRRGFEDASLAVNTMGELINPLFLIRLGAA